MKSFKITIHIVSNISDNDNGEDIRDDIVHFIADELGLDVMASTIEETEDDHDDKE
jgi:hypothetical protein